jgi:malonate-semialdehyde dehydrogenase (acetylating)/methylmalonate-semialdehyde dehydrogenase
VGVCAAIVPFNFLMMVPFWFMPFASATVARHPYETAAAHGKRVQALGGAKNYMVVMPDAVLDKTVTNIVSSAFGAAGQRCMAGSVVVTVGAAHAPLPEGLRAATKGLRVGDGMDDGVAVGPLVSPSARDRVHACIDRALAEGAHLLVDGRGVDVTPEMEAAREEIFGPVLSVIHAESLDDAIAIVNRSRYGNGTSIFTESGAAVRRYSHEIEVGMVGVNVGVAAPVAFFPFSGWKDSFLGDLHAHGGDAVDFYRRKKTITSRFFTEESGKSFTEQ